MSTYCVMNMMWHGEEHLRINLFASIKLQITSQSLVSSEKFNEATKILSKGLYNRMGKAKEPWRKVKKINKLKEEEDEEVWSDSGEPIIVWVRR